MFLVEICFFSSKLCNCTIHSFFFGITSNCSELLLSKWINECIDHIVYLTESIEFISLIWNGPNMLNYRFNCCYNFCFISLICINNKIIKQYVNYEHTNGGSYQLKTIEKFHNSDQQFSHLFVCHSCRLIGVLFITRAKLIDALNISI